MGLSTAFPIETILKVVGNHTYRIYEDGGHAWIRVRIIELMALTLEYDITPFSYIKGQYAYLEEDCDLTKFYTAYVATTGREPKHTVIYSERCRIRNYARYTPEKAYRYIAGGLS
jgi:hypothetical protein